MNAPLHNATEYPTLSVLIPASEGILGTVNITKFGLSAVTRADQTGHAIVHLLETTYITDAMTTYRSCIYVSDSRHLLRQYKP